MKKQPMFATIFVLTLILSGSIAIDRKAAAATMVAPIVPGSMVPDEWSHPSGFKFWLPDNWKIKADGDMLTAIGPDSEIYFFVPKNAKTFDSALEEVDEELAAWLKGIKFDKPTGSNVGGIHEAFISGTGKDHKSGEAMEFGLGIYEKKGKVMMIFGATTDEHFERFIKVFKKVVDSIK